jgi:hypothetical protein
MPLSSRYDGAEARVVAFAGRQFAVRSAAAEVLEAVEFIAGPHLTAYAGSGQSGLEIDRDGGAYAFVDPVSCQPTAVAASELDQTLAGVLVYGLVESNDDHVILHAAALDYRGSAVLLIAPAGSGKTTLTSWLLGQGFGYMTDECVAIDAQGRASGFARPLNIKDTGIDVVRSFPWLHPDLVGTRRSGRVTFVRPRTSLQARAPLSALIFPRFVAGAALRSELLSVGRCTQSLMSNLLNARNLPARGLRRVASLARKVPAYEVQFSDLSSTSAWLRGVCHRQDTQIGGLRP